MNKPLIAVNCRAIQKSYNRHIYDNENYLSCLQQAGALPAIQAPSGPVMAAETAMRYDGLLLTGGEDVNPELYGQKNQGSFVIDADLDSSDIALYKAFLAAGKPILGICRGIQVINVAEGGTLVQDIQTADPECMEHEQTRRVPPLLRSQTSHDVTFTEGTRLYQLFGAGYAVNSFHHQAVDRPAAGFTICARAQDGVIEAMEKPGVTAVQWHPERLFEDPKQRKLFTDFVEDCREAAKRRGIHVQCTEKPYRVITLCGSTRFKEDFLREQKRLTLAGNIVLTVGLFGHAGDTEVWEGMDENTATRTKEMLDDMHKRKIDLSDGIFVINPGGYIGASTKAEIAYARTHGKTVDYMEERKEPEG